jgi:hypothetical protein
MSLRIACDLDGTVADMDAALQREASRLFGPDVDLRALPNERLESAEDVEGQIVESESDAVTSSSTTAGAGRPLTSRELRQLWRHVAQIDNFWMSLGEVEPGAVARLGALATQHRWDVIFLTQRPSTAGQTTQMQSHQWLKAHGFEWPNVMVMRGSRGKVAAALSLDVVLDDRPQNCLDVIADSEARPLLIWRFGADRIPSHVTRLGVQAVQTMAEAFAHLEATTAERVRNRDRTVFGRLRRAFGRTQ